MSIFILSFGTLLVFVWFILTILGAKKHSSLFDSLLEIEYPLKGLYIIGYYVLTALGYSFSSSFDLELKHRFETTDDKKYADFYVRTIRSAQLTYIFLFIILGCVFYGFINNVLIFVLFIILGITVAYYFSYRTKLKIVNQKGELMSDFCQVVSSLALLGNTGMLPREAWDVVSNSSDSLIYEEMKLVTKKIKNGISERVAILDFANRSNLSEVRKFCTVYLEGINKDSGGFAKMLETQSRIVWQERKQEVLRLGENAGLKLMIPSLIMFVGILILVLVPIASSFGAFNCVIILIIMFNKFSSFVFLFIFSSFLILNLLVPFKSAYAEEPFAVSSQITDSNSVLGEAKTELNDLIRSVNSKTGQNLYLIFIDSFSEQSEDVDKDGKIDNLDWVKDLARRSNFSDNDVVLVVATIKHEIIIYTSADNKYLKQKNINQITNATMVPLRNGDWAEAAKTFCNSVQKQINNKPNAFGYVFILILIIALVVFLAKSSRNRLLEQGIQKESFFKRFFKQRKSKKEQLEIQQTFSAVDADYIPADQLNFDDNFGQMQSFDQTYEYSNNYQTSSYDYNNPVVNNYDSNFNSFPEYSNNVSVDENIYGDYYTNAYAREAYGSYYNENLAGKHDEQLNQFSENVDNNQYNQYTVQSDQAGNNSTEELYGSYYDNENPSFFQNFPNFRK